MPIRSRPKKIWFLGSEPLNVIGHHRDPKRHILGRNHTSMPLVQNGPLVRPVRKTKKSKKKKEKKARKETYSGKLGVRVEHPRWRTDMWSCMPSGLREIVLSFKFRQNRMNSFRDVGVEICHFDFLYLRPVAYKSLYYPTLARIRLSSFRGRRSE